MNEITLDYLREEIRLCNATADMLKQEAMKYNDGEAWVSSMTIQGQAYAYQEMIKYMRGLTEREYRLALKKGTL